MIPPQPSLTTPDLLSLEHFQLLDFAGIDGLQLAKALVGQQAERLAPFQSLEAVVQDQPCSLLRLCEGNFRLRVQGNPDLEPFLQSYSSGWRAWVKSHAWMGAIALPELIGFKILADLAVPKPPHRLKALPVNCAIPARIDGLSVLIWRHHLLNQPILELHTAIAHVEIIKINLMKHRAAHTLCD
jgi:hypothetical protein